MNQFLMCTKGKLNDVVLQPRIALSLSHHNKKTGTGSGTKSISFSACITLWNLMLWILGIMLAMRIFWCFFKMKESRKIRKKMRRRNKKMSKS